MTPDFMDNSTLPIETILTELCETLASRNQVILTAPPGAGKTTRVPLALLEICVNCLHAYGCCATHSIGLAEMMVPAYAALKAFA